MVALAEDIFIIFFQDTAKSNSDLFKDAKAIDLNRAGCALMEIVSQPDMRYDF